jgi:hypothetical protein
MVEISVGFIDVTLYYKSSKHDSSRKLGPTIQKTEKLLFMEKGFGIAVRSSGKST